MIATVSSTDMFPRENQTGLPGKHVTGEALTRSARPRPQFRRIKKENKAFVARVLSCGDLGVGCPPRDRVQTGSNIVGQRREARAGEGRGGERSSRQAK